MVIYIKNLCFNYQMQNILLMKRTEEIKEFSKQLGFKETLFLENITIIEEKTKKELLKKINRAKNKLTIYKPSSEEMLRFVLEKSKIDAILGMENINLKDSMHYVRGGLDQISCKIAAEKGKIVAFSFNEILNSKNRSRLLARMRLNIKLCRKYKVKTIFSNFAKSRNEIRSAKDLEAFRKILEKEKLW